MEERFKFKCVEYIEDETGYSFQVVTNDDMQERQKDEFWWRFHKAFLKTVKDMDFTKESKYN
jgi:hypothetical protein